MSAIPARTAANGIPHGGIRDAGVSRKLKSRWIPGLVAGLTLACLAALGLALFSPASLHPRAMPVQLNPRHGIETAVPVSLAPAASASIGASQRSFWPARNGDALLSSGGGIHSTFTASGATLRVARGTLGLALAAVGRGKRLESEPAATPAAAQNQVLYNRGSIDESFRNGPYGLEQGFTVNRRPRTGSGPLVLELRLGGSLIPQQSGSQILFRTHAGATALLYGQLSATDATGRRLPAHMAIRNGALQLLIDDDDDARYPVRIDPFVQQGSKLTGTGESGDGKFGDSVALSADGNTALVGTPNDNGGIGAAWVFLRTDGVWTQQGGKLTGSGEVGEGSFGSAVALSSDGDTALVGGSGDNDDTGAAWVFTRSGATWSQQGQKLVFPPSEGGFDGEFGFSVALSADGDTALIGGIGEAWVFARVGEEWARLKGGKLVGCDRRLPGESCAFGFSVALSADGDTALVGSPEEAFANSGTEFGVGGAWVFTRSGEDFDEQGPSLTGGGESGKGRFGDSVALSPEGDTALIGGPGDLSANVGNNGAAWIFTRSGETWTQRGEKLKGDGGSEFGSSVALSSGADTAVIGARHDDADAGAAWVFARSGETWIQQGEKLTGTGEVGAGELGVSVALSADGSTTLIGGPDDAGGLRGVGAAWVFAPPLPTVVTEAASALTPGTATLNATVDPNGWPPSECELEYGTSTTYGASAPCTPTPGSGSSPVAVSAQIAGLTAETTYHFRVRASNPGGTGYGADQTFTTPAVQLPASVAFTISPYTDPLLSHETITFAITDPTPGVTYQWDFGNRDQPLDSAGAPFVVEATGTSVTYAYPDPPVTAGAPEGVLCPQGQAGCGSGSPFAVYDVRARAVIATASVSAPPQKVVVVPVQKPTAAFLLLRSEQNNEGTGVSTAVTRPVTIVPQATLPETDSGAGDRIVREDFWINSQDAGTPDITCLPNGICGHYAGSKLEPSARELTPLPGEEGAGTGPLTQYGTKAPPTDQTGCLLAHAHCTHYSIPTYGFESFSMNFWNAALAGIGSNGIATLPQEQDEEHNIETDRYTQPPLTVGYPPLASVNLAEADGDEDPNFNGGRDRSGIFNEGCFTGYPGEPPYSYPPCHGASGGFEPIDRFSDDDLVSPSGVAYDPYRLEDEWNFLYNYATVVGVDTPLNSERGPATGAHAGPGKSTVPRTVTMVAYDAEGIASEPSTQSVPLTPATHPSTQICVQDLSKPHSGCFPAGAGTKEPPFAITAGDKLRFNTEQSNGGDEPILYYAAELGQPNSAKYCTTQQSVSGGAFNPDALHAPHSSAKHARVAALAPGSANKPPVVQQRQEVTFERQPPFPIPAFSDLLAGAYPYHVCAEYAERTVDANTEPGALPEKGPDQLRAVASAARRSAATAHAASSGTPPPLQIDRNASGFAGPEITIPQAKPGTYSVSVAAYNASGLGAITRIDGLAALPASKPGPCVSEETYPIYLPGSHSGHPRKLGFSGKCLSTVTSSTGPSGNGSALLFASTAAIDIDGVPLTPAQGQVIVIKPTEGAEGTAEIYVLPTADCKISRFSYDEEEVKELEGKRSPHKSLPCAESASKAGSLFLALGGGPGQPAPGIAEWAHFTTDKARVAFGPPIGSAKVKGCGLLANGQSWEATRAEFDGFDVVKNTPCVEVTNSGTSKIEFYDALPPGFERKHGGKGTTPKVNFAGEDVPPISAFATNPYANVARHHARHVVAGSEDNVYAHAASGGEIAFPHVKECPAGTGGSHAEIPQESELGGIELPVGAKFCYESKRGVFIGNIVVKIPGPLPIEKVAVGFEIGHGRLIQAGGEIKAHLTVGPGVIFDEFKFDIQTEPTVVAAAVEASIAEILAVEGAAVVRASSPAYVDIKGTVTVPIEGLKLANFELYFSSQYDSMNVHIGDEFGPVGVEIGVEGVMELKPKFVYYLKGEGKACLLICVKAQGLVSSIGLAACGSINLLFTEISVGVGWLWSGPDSGVHIFTGCDLEGYIPPQLRHFANASRHLAGTPPARSSVSRRTLSPAQPPTQETLAPGQSLKLVLNESGLCTPADVKQPTEQPSGCTKGAVAVQIHSLASQAGVGGAPRVTLTGPAGEDPRVIETPESPDQFSFNPGTSSSASLFSAPAGATQEGSSLVDQDPVPVHDTVANSAARCGASSCPPVTTTTIFVADPGTKEWTLSVDQGSAPVVDVSVAQPTAPVTADEFHASVNDAYLTDTFHGRIATTAAARHTVNLPVAPSKLAKLLRQKALMLAPSVEIRPRSVDGAAALAHPTLGDLDVPTLDRPMLREIDLKVPSKWKGTVALIDHGPTGSAVIASDVKASTIPRGGQPILFMPTSGFGATHKIEAFLSNDEGIPSRSIVLGTYAAPALPTPAAPVITRIARRGSTVDVYFKPGDAPIAEGLPYGLTTANGVDIEGKVRESRLRAIGTRHGLGGAAEAGEYMFAIRDIDPTEPIDVTLNGLADERLSRTASRRVPAAIGSTSESALIGKLRVKLAHRRSARRR